jgi:hypothetical protein
LEKTEMQQPGIKGGFPTLSALTQTGSRGYSLPAMGQNAEIYRTINQKRG